MHRKEPSSLHIAEQRARLNNDQLDRIQSLIAALKAALAPLEGLASAKPYDFAELAQRHRDILLELSRDEHGIALAFEGRDGLALAAAFDELLSEQRRSGLMLQLADYPDVFQAAFADRAVRRPERAGAKLHIYGPLESRLMQADRIIIGADSGNDIRVGGPGVEAKHAQITVSMAGYTVIDMNTPHGTRVNAEKMRERLLRDQDVVQVGAARWVFREG